MAIFHTTTKAILKDFTDKVSHLREHAHAQTIREEKLAAKEAKLRGERVACGADAKAALAAADKIEAFIGQV